MKKEVNKSLCDNNVLHNAKYYWKAKIIDNNDGTFQDYKIFKSFCQECQQGERCDTIF